MNDDNLIDDGRVAVHGKFVNVLTLNFQNDLTNTHKTIVELPFLKIYFLFLICKLTNYENSF